MFKVLNIPEIYNAILALPFVGDFLDTCFVVEF